MTAIRLYAADLFAGAGGLSLGLQRAGFDVRVAVELSDEAASTYAQNHPDTTLLTADISTTKGKELLAAIPTGRMAVLAGCAPCQGFCSLTLKHKKEDPRNRLLLEMARLVEETKPDAVVMENVPGLATRGKSVFAAFLKRLKKAGYHASWSVLQMANFGIPQNRRRLVLVAGRGFKISLPTTTHARVPGPDGRRKAWRSLKHVIGNQNVPVTLSRALKSSSPRKLNWHVVRDLQPQTKARLSKALPGETWKTYDEKLRPVCHREGYTGFLNVYGRMTWEQLPVTITAGCTTPAKGRFGHPDRRRTTISVREAASIQTFPKSYRFATNRIDAACEMIGNAVPPAFATLIGEQVVKAIRKHHADTNRKRRRPARRTTRRKSQAA